MIRSAITPESVLVEKGSTVSFECLAYTNNDNHVLAYEWVYPAELAGVVAVQDQVLVVRSADTANIMCVVTLEGAGLVSTANASLVIGEFTSIVPSLT